MSTKIGQKITYNAETLYYLKIPDWQKSIVKTAGEINKGDAICKPQQSSDLVEIEYSGNANVSAGDEIREGDVIAVSGKVKKVEIKAPVTGKIFSIDDKKIAISKGASDSEFSEELTKSPFKAKVKNVTKKGILLEFPSVTINLLVSKGNSVVGNIEYIPGEKFKTKPRPEINPGTILVTDTVTKESYAIMSTMGAAGIIVNSVDYSMYRDIIILAVPLGIITGFGALKEDAEFTKYFREKSGESVWFDTQFERLVIFEENEPSWVNKHQFDLSEIEIK